MPTSSAEVRVHRTPGGDPAPADPIRAASGAPTGAAPEQFIPLLTALWREMDSGGFSVVLRRNLPRFNGKLFKQPHVLPLDRAQIAHLLEAAKSDWTLVEPAIFGTLLERYVEPRRAEWPQADYVVGNPPFIGASTMRAALGDGYVEALRGVWNEVPESADFVMYWWHHAASLARAGQIRRFGFITTNSIRQTFNRRLLESALDGGVTLLFAIPDHPWVDEALGAAVRIAMTVPRPGRAKAACSASSMQASASARMLPGPGRSRPTPGSARPASSCTERASSSRRNRPKPYVAPASRRRLLTPPARRRRYKTR